MVKNLLALWLICLVLMPVALSGQWLGAGSQMNPYQISTASDLANLASNVNAGNSYNGVFFKLMNTIDLNVAPYNTGTGWVPIGSYYEEYPFSGTFDGNGMTISGLFISTEDVSPAGVFGYIDGALIRNLNLTGINVTGQEHLGGLVGVAGHSSIRNCSVGGNMSPQYNSGGLVGTAFDTVIHTCSSSVEFSFTGTRADTIGGLLGWGQQNVSVINCSSSGSLLADQTNWKHVQLGGLIGLIDNNSIVSNCHSSANVSASYYAGGLIGLCVWTTVSYSYATGNVTAGVLGAGLIASIGVSTVHHCYATGNVSRGSNLGGLIGLSWTGNIYQCYATGTITGAGYVGGFIAVIYATTIANCYAIGNASGAISGGFVGGIYGQSSVENCFSTGSATGIYMVGGFVGRNHFSPEDTISMDQCYWNTESSGNANGTGSGPSVGITGINNTQMADPNTFEGWDFVEVWRLITGSSHPTLIFAGNDYTLPVVLSSFTATMSAENYVTLVWVTQSESMLSGYYIYRSEQPAFSTAMLVSPLIAGTNTHQQQTYRFTDSDLQTEGTYYYWLQSIDLDASIETYGPVSVIYTVNTNYPTTPEIPNVTTLNMIYPNPFNPSAGISYNLKEDAPVTISVFNSKGQLVKRMQNLPSTKGYHRTYWDGRDASGNNCSSGIYIFKMQAGNRTFVRKAVLSK